MIIDLFVNQNTPKGVPPRIAKLSLSEHLSRRGEIDGDGNG